MVVIRSLFMKQTMTIQQPDPAKPDNAPIKDPQPYRDPIEKPPGDPGEDRPMRDPTPPSKDQPSMSPA